MQGTQYVSHSYSTALLLYCTLRRYSTALLLYMYFITSSLHSYSTSSLHPFITSSLHHFVTSSLQLITYLYIVFLGTWYVSIISLT